MDKLHAAGTYRFEISAKAVLDGESGEATMAGDADVARSRLRMNVDLQAVQLEVVWADGQTFLRSETTDGKWEVAPREPGDVDLDDEDVPPVSWHAVFVPPHDPVGAVRALRGAVEAEAGEEHRLRGDRVRRYDVVLDGDILFGELARPLGGEIRMRRRPARVEAEAWVDEEGRLRRFAYRFRAPAGYFSYDVTCFDLGAPVVVERPPAVADA